MGWTGSTHAVCLPEDDSHGFNLGVCGGLVHYTFLICHIRKRCGGLNVMKGHIGDQADVFFTAGKLYCHQFDFSISFCVMRQLAVFRAVCVGNVGGHAVLP